MTLEEFNKKYDRWYTVNCRDLTHIKLESKKTKRWLLEFATHLFTVPLEMSGFDKYKKPELFIDFTNLCRTLTKNVH